VVVLARGLAQPPALALGKVLVQPPAMAMAMVQRLALVLVNLLRVRVPERAQGPESHWALPLQEQALVPEQPKPARQALVVHPLLGAARCSTASQSRPPPRLGWRRPRCRCRRKRTRRKWRRKERQVERQGSMSWFSWDGAKGRLATIEATHRSRDARLA
jgi:hypothetical protein